MSGTFDYWIHKADAMTADDWTRARSDLELAELLAEHRLEITQPGCGECSLEYHDEVLEIIGEVRRRTARAREMLCLASSPVPWMPAAETSSCSS